MIDGKTRYSVEELEEFKVLINEKIAIAKADFDQIREMMSNGTGNDVSDTSPVYKNLEEGEVTMSKEQLGIQSQRLMKYIRNLEAALVRIENGTYGVCRATGKLIQKERLRIVPHATLSIDAKLNQDNNK